MSGTVSEPASSAAAAARTTTGIPGDGGEDRAVRVFVSSTFRDMNGERDELARTTFPALQRTFRGRGVELLCVDLRWGVLKEEDVPCEVCLAEVDRCRPWFIGILGERYGTVLTPDQVTPALQDAFPVLKGAVGCSLTEVEILQGVLAAPAKPPHAFFFERDPAWLDTLGAKERGEFQESTEASRGQLADLKARLRDVTPLKQYATPADIGPAVEAALGAALDAQFPLTEALDAQDAFTQAHRLHAAYARDRLGVLAGGEPNLDSLNRWLAQSGAPPLLVSAPSGGGKSTLIAHWLRDLRDLRTGDILFAHHLGASPDSADPALLMRRLWEHLDRATGETVDLPAGEFELMALAAGLADRLARAAASASRAGVRIVIALDGLDKLSREANLRWLPAVTAPNVKLLAASLEGEAREAALGRGWQVLEIAPLDEPSRRLLAAGTLRRWGRKLSQVRLGRLLACPMSGLPLFLKTVLEELRVSATEEVLDERLDRYLGAPGMPSLFTLVLARLEQDCTESLVRHALSLVWAARAGLEEAEILALTGATPLAWARLRNALGDALRDQAGRIAFGHDFLRAAAGVRYLSSPASQQAAHLQLAGRFEGRDPDARQAEELPYQLSRAQAWDRLEALLTSLDRFALLQGRGNGELLGHWLALRERDPEALLWAAFRERAGEPERWTRADSDLAFALGDFFHYIGAAGEGRLNLGAQHVQACERIFGREHPDTLVCLSNCGGALSARGDFEGAQRLFERVRDAHTRLLGPDHADTLRNQNNLANTLSDRGDLEAAQRLHEEVLEARVRVLGPEHPDTLITLNNLAETVSDRGDLVRAQQLHARVLEANRRVLGPNHPETLGSQSNLAKVLAELGHLEEARRMEEGVREARTRLLGPEHRDTLSSLISLAAMHSASGDHEAARRLNEQVLAIDTRVLGPEHPDTLTSAANLAISLSDLGELEEARRIEEAVLAARTRTLGSDHPDTLNSMASLAGTLAELGEEEEALPLQEHVLAARTRLLGPEHPDTLTTLGSLGGLLTHDDPDRARDLLEGALEARTRLLGPEHPDTLRGMGNLAIARSHAGDFEGAAEILEQLREVRTRVQGPEHPDTLETLSNLAVTCSDRGLIEEACRRHEQVLEARGRLLGPAHPDTLVSMTNLATVLSEGGDPERGRKLFERVLAIHTDLLGPDHPETLMSVINLAAALANSGDLEGAQRLEEQVLEARERLLGPDHPDTLAALNDLGGTLFARGDLEGARRHFSRVAEAALRTVGPEHPLAFAAAENLARCQDG